MTQLIRTSEIFSETIWDDTVAKCGGYNSSGVTPGSRWCDNKGLQKCPFYARRRKIFSQNGEDGILEAIFRKIGCTNKWAIELGAGDGYTISNTYRLRRDGGFRRLLVEGDRKQRINAKCRGEQLVYALVTSSSINDLLEDCPAHPDLLSIDIDGDDYWVLKAMVKKPRIVILEYHTGLPNEIPLVCKESCGTVESYEGVGWNDRRDREHQANIRTLNGYYGANMLAFDRLMREKGYAFVTSSCDNLIYVLEEEYSKLGVDRISEQDMLDHYFCPNGYWGEIHRDMYDNEWVIPE